MILLNPFATLLVLILILLPAPLLIIFSRLIRKFSSAGQADQDKANAVMEESLVGIREIKSFILEKFKLKQYNESLKNGTEREMKAAKLHSKINHTFYFILSLMLLLIFYKGSLLSGSSGWSIGGVIAFYFYSYTLAMALLAMGRAYMNYQTLVAAADRIYELLGDYEILDTSLIAPETLKLKGDIEFRNINFKYKENKPVLTKFSLKIRAKTTTFMYNRKHL